MPAQTEMANVTAFVDIANIAQYTGQQVLQRFSYLHAGRFLAALRSYLFGVTKGLCIRRVFLTFKTVCITILAHYMYNKWIPFPYMDRNLLQSQVHR